MLFAPTPRSRAVRAGLAATALLLVASCSDDPAGDPGTEESLNLSPSKSAGSEWSPEQQEVISGLTSYRDLVSAISQGKAVKQHTMEAVAVDPFARKMAEQLATQQSAGFVMEGEEEYTPKSVRVTGETAALVACWDPSTATIVNEFQSPPATVKPAPRTLITFSFERSGEDWLVAGRDPGRSC